MGDQKVSTYFPVHSVCDCCTVSPNDGCVPSNFFESVLLIIAQICYSPWGIAIEKRNSWSVRVIFALIAVFTVPVGITLTFLFKAVVIAIAIIVLVTMLLILAGYATQKAFFDWLWPLESLRLKKEE